MDNPTSPPDPTSLGLSNARSKVLQTILLDEDIPSFLTTFNLPIPRNPPKRLDIPRGVSFDSWLRRMLQDPHEAIPPAIPTSLTKLALGPIYNITSPTQPFPYPVWTTRLKPSGTYPETVQRIFRILETMKIDGQLMYRGTSRNEAREAFIQFKPAPIECTDLGKGLYTTAVAELAVAYAGACGVVWVFMRQDYGGLIKAALRGNEWALVAGQGSQVASKLDIIQGAVSEDRGPAGMQDCMGGKVKVQEMEGIGKWLCWRTPEARKVLAGGLVAMVFLDG